MVFKERSAISQALHVCRERILHQHGGRHARPPPPNTQCLLTLIYPEVFINRLGVRHFHTDEGHLFRISNSLQGQTSSPHDAGIPTFLMRKQGGTGERTGSQSLSR